MPSIQINSFFQGLGANLTSAKGAQQQHPQFYKLPSSQTRRLKELASFSLEAQRAVCEILLIFLGWCNKCRVRFFSVVTSNRTLHNGQKLKQRKLYLNRREIFLTLEVVQHWNRLLRDSMEFSSLEILKSLLDTDLCNLLQLTLL